MSTSFELGNSDEIDYENGDYEWKYFPYGMKWAWRLKNKTLPEHPISMQVKRLNDGKEVWVNDDEGYRCKEYEVKYLVLNATDKQDAICAVIDDAPKKAPNSALFLQNVSFDGYTGEGNIECTAHYAVNQYSPNTDRSRPDNSYQFDVSGGTHHITQSRETVVHRGVDTGGVIGWDGDTAQGCDITVPIFTFSETIYKKYNKVTTAYQKKLANAVGTVNDSKFRGFDKGEVLFTGVSGSRVPEEYYWELTFKFAVQRNEIDKNFGQYTVSKYGWDYLWVWADKQWDANDEFMKPKIKGVYVERVYRYTNFRNLEIGS